MSIGVGTRLNSYEIVAQLGAGGMGEVYRARDSKLDRDVAVKVLADGLATDQARRVRFEREARALAALNHPNIAQVYDSGTAGSTDYLVMELVPGEDLAAIIARGRLSIADALGISRQIVDALEAAHNAGIVHRDLKPANIRVRLDGTVKVLDFGLAKLLPNAEGVGPGPLSDSPTVTAAAETMRGTVLGTAAYMSPEQARGNAVDQRSDIWAFGAVLYELLTGRRAFPGDSVADVLAAVMRLDPDWSALPSDLPPAIRALLEGCLQKERTVRMADISTARFVIDRAPALAGPPGTAPQSARRSSTVLAASTAVLALVSSVLLWMVFRPPPATVTRHTVTPSEEQRLAETAGVDLALSPDGTWMVYVGVAPGGGTRLLRRNLDDLDAVALPGTEGGAAPEVSPDGRAIAFYANGAIRTLSLDGGPPATIVPANGSAPAWGDDGMIYYGRGNLTYRVPAQGGEPVAVTTAEPNVLQQHVDALPDGRGLLLSLHTGTPAQAKIGVVGPDGGRVRPLFAGTMARYSDSGHVVYATANGALLAAPFDLQRLEVTGPPVPVVDGVAVASDGTTEFAVSRSGALLYTTGIGLASELVWVGRTGAVTPVDSSWIAEFGSPALSPDGTQLAVAIQGPETKDIWVMQLDRGSKLRLTLDGSRNDFPTWTPDGRSVTFTSDRNGPSFDLWTKRSDGIGDPRLELDEEWALAESLWSPDAAWFVHRTSTNVRGAGDILGSRRDRDVKPTPIVASRFSELTPAISPNGRWLAYSSTETGRREVVVVPFPNAGDAKWPVSVAGGAEPLWSRDGTELFYRNAKRELVSVRVQTAGSFSIGATSVVFPERDYLRLDVVRQYAVAPDGRRFLMVRPVGVGRERRVILVRNAFGGRPAIS